MGKPIKLSNVSHYSGSFSKGSAKATASGPKCLPLRVRIIEIIRLGAVLREIYEAKLKWQFPDRPCMVEFYTPEDEDDLMQYQISFWQKAQE